MTIGKLSGSQASQASRAPAQPGASPSVSAPSASASGPASPSPDSLRPDALRKRDLLPPVNASAPQDALPPHQRAAISRAVLLVPDAPAPGVAIAIKDLTDYLQAVTGKPVRTLPLSQASSLPDLAGATVIAIGDGKPVDGLLPSPSGKPEGYVIQAKQAQLGGQRVPLIALNGDDLAGQQYAVYRLMELSGKRFFSYTDTFQPTNPTFPAGGFVERYAPSDQMKVRGFSPHTYHPIPLSIAFHQPSAEHLAMMKRYIDWCVQNRQNYVALPLLELDASNPYLPIRRGDDQYRAWLPHAQAIVEYAKQRGVDVAVNVAFASYMSANVYAINPALASWQSARLSGKQKPLLEAQEQLREVEAELAEKMVAPGDHTEAIRALQARRADLTSKVRTRQTEYEALLSEYRATDATKIGEFIERLMEVPWDEIQWNLGTSEFTPASDDLTIAWMNDAAAYLSKHHPDVRTTVTSHVPSHPFSEKYQTPYFDLVKFTDPDVGVLVHTTHAFALTDPAPVYGNESFEHKLDLMRESASPGRLDVYYPETSYWVGHDANVPLFLPVYMLNRKHDMELIKPIAHMDGQVGFTTAWEWGYWLNDYALARMQSDPDQSLTQVLEGAFAPFGESRTAMVETLSAYMLEQQHYLIDKGLIRHLQGFSSLTDLGAFAARTPILKDILPGANNNPVRLEPKAILKWSADEVAAFEKGELADLRGMTESFQSFASRVEGMKGRIPAEAERYYQELLHGFQITALRAELSLKVMEAALLARKAKLTRDGGFEAQGKAAVARAEAVVEEAMRIIREREAAYREGPEYTYAEGRTGTMWGDRYLTQVHTGEYWKRTLAEAQELF